MFIFKLTDYSPEKTDRCCIKCKYDRFVTDVICVNSGNMYLPNVYFPVAFIHE
jgi:hypothetical protein